MGDNGRQASPAWQAEAISGFARSELFDRTFKEGMDLVEETAAYLDGAGRQDSKLLSRSAALSYAAESMRLTTRLMQVASWLLVQRAVREGDMAAEAAQDASYRLAAETPDPDRSASAEPLPQRSPSCSAVPSACSSACAISMRGCTPTASRPSRRTRCCRRSSASRTPSAARARCGQAEPPDR